MTRKEALKELDRKREADARWYSGNDMLGMHMFVELNEGRWAYSYDKNVITEAVAIAVKMLEENINTGNN